MAKSQTGNTIVKDTLYEIIKYVVYILITVSVLAFTIRHDEKELIKNFETISSYFSPMTLIYFSVTILLIIGVLGGLKTIIAEDVKELDGPIVLCTKWLISIWGNFYYSFVIGLLSFFVYFLLFVHLYAQNLIGTPDYHSLFKSVWGIFIVGGAECIAIKVFLKRKGYPS
ncbi:hypothetical protein [Acinetobacter seifertii]|uniref:hypothetical protein n=1 Tax=Acinetobacter seifertii TaxID=1530123 RepID=UPI001905CB51|nr:hypothetical protein [Acinetobacter seifertii]MBJ9425839.1 hypothetical protein [Acinetobacter seifertii]